MSWWEVSNEYPQHIIFEKWKKNLDNLLIEPLNGPP